MSNYLSPDARAFLRDSLAAAARVFANGDAGEQRLCAALGLAPPPGRCPVCREPGGFHNDRPGGAHSAVRVPPELAWKPGAVPVYLRESETTDG